MKQIITFILLSLYLSTITAQIPNLLGNWTAGWQTNASACCIPTGIEITQVNNTYQASFTFASYYAFFNAYCFSNGITGNFIENFTFSGNYSLPIGYATVENIILGNNTNSTINLTSGTYISSLGTTLGPFFGVSINGCNYNIVPSSSSSTSLATYASDFTGNYTSINSVKGFNSSSNTSNQLSNTCCTPSSVSIQFLGSLPYFNLTATFSQANLSNAWCVEGNINNTIVTNQFYGALASESNLTWWIDSTNSYQIIMDANSPGYIIGNFYGVDNSICSFNMSLVNFGGKLAISSVIGIISLLMISLL